MPTASFRFYGALNDFLPASSRQATLVVAFKAAASVKDLVEALGVPHPEIDRIVVNGETVSFGYGVRDGDRVAAYPAFAVLDLGETGRLGPAPQAVPRFVADVHLGRLAGYLRLAGFDTWYRTAASDHALVQVSADEDRTLLTRDVGALKHRVVTRGYFVRAVEPARQLVEVARRFGLARAAAPFSRCVRCNEGLRPVAKADVVARLPERTREAFTDYRQCPGCERVYWQGSHYSRLHAFLEAAFREADSPGADSTDPLDRTPP